LIDPLLNLAQVKSWSAFAKQASRAAIESEGGRLSIVPSRNLGPDEGFRGLESEAVTLSDQASPGQLGAAVRALLRKGAA
jgi:hypothetical protein